jgi:hypothetical protein
LSNPWLKRVLGMTALGPEFTFDGLKSRRSAGFVIERPVPSTLLTV